MICVDHRNNKSYFLQSRPSFLMQVCLQEAGTLKKLFSAIEELVIDSDLQVSEDGMYLQAMDSANVALTELRLNRGGFKSFVCTEPLNLGLSFKAVSRILKMAKNEDSVMISHTGGRTKEADELTFEFSSTTTGATETYILNLLTIESRQLDLPEREEECVIEIESQEWSRVMRNLITIGENVDISVSKGSVIFKTSGDLAKGNIKLVNTTNVNIKCKSPFTQTFNLKYLGNFCRAASLSTEQTIHLYPDLPACITFPIDELGDLKFYLAPKVDDL